MQARAGRARVQILYAACARERWTRTHACMHAPCTHAHTHTHTHTLIRARAHTSAYCRQCARSCASESLDANLFYAARICAYARALPRACSARVARRRAGACSRSRAHPPRNTPCAQAAKRAPWAPKRAPPANAREGVRLPACSRASANSTPAQARPTPLVGNGRVPPQRTHRCPGPRAARPVPALHACLCLRLCAQARKRSQ